MAALTDRDKLAAPSAAAIEALNKRQAAEFRDLLGTPPDPANVPDAFWARVKKENEEALVALLLLIFIASYDRHRTWGTMEPPDSGKARDRIAGEWTSRRAADVAKGIVRRSKDLAGAAGREWKSRQQSRKPVTSDEIDSLIDTIFGESRVDTIVRTEGQQAVVEGGDSAVIHATKASGIKVTRYWGHWGAISERPKGHCNARQDPCPLCSPREGLPESQWGGLWPGQCHPNDDCFVVYVDQDGFVIGTDKPGMRPGNAPGMVWVYQPDDVIAA